MAPTSSDDDSPAVPFTILTGWLGAGKTTTLNRMLGAPHGRRIAVLINELGRIAIDGKLILRRGGDILELAGGCICCKVDLKNDLWDGIGDIVARSKPEHVVLETTGIAEPGAILAQMHRVPAKFGARVEAAGIVCVVDAETAVATLAKRDEAREQVIAADRVLLTKLDRCDAATVTAAHRAIDTLNPGVERVSFGGDDDGAMALTAWMLEPARTRSTHAHHEHVHRHPHADGQLIAVSFRDAAPLVGEQVLAIARGLGDRLVRAKGYVHLAGSNRRHFLEKAGAVLELRDAGEWDGAPTTELVLIGEALDESVVRRALWACRVGR